ncbi:MAG: four helix bundle protein [Clostridium sp.]|jgi:hypothetical protein|nr:four helix bundle protein [Clostridium sp.]
MKEEKFKVINYIRELIVYMDAHLNNFPKKDIEIKSKLKEQSYELLELAYKANLTSQEKRESLIEDIIAKVKLIDFLLNLCYDKEIINSKRYVKFGQKLDDIIKYATGWKKTINTN